MEPRPHERGKARMLNTQCTWSSASMEPRPHERGKSVDVGNPFAWRRSFNGATSSRTWKGITADFDVARLFASMEPRPHERGKCNLPFSASIAAQLQWSHVLTNVERT